MTLLKLSVTTRQMTRMAWGAAMIGVSVLGSAVTVAAQQDGRVFISVNGGLQASSTDFTDNIVFTEFLEEGDLDTAYSIDSGAVIDIGGGFKLLDTQFVTDHLRQFGAEEIPARIYLARLDAALAYQGVFHAELDEETERGAMEELFESADNAS